MVSVEDDHVNPSFETIFIDELMRSVKDGNQVDAVVMDFSKAFHVVPHGILLVKLDYYGIRGHTLKWIDSFSVTVHREWW